MLFRLTAAALLLTASAAQADTIGADFCETLRTQHVACINEANVRVAGNYLRVCPKARASFESAYEKARSRASEQMKKPIDEAHALWQEISTKPLPQVGESAEAYITRNGAETDKVNAACDQLYALDSN